MVCNKHKTPSIVIMAYPTRNGNFADNEWGLPHSKHTFHQKRVGENPLEWNFLHETSGDTPFVNLQIMEKNALKFKNLPF